MAVLEAIAAVCRALACDAKLVMLYHLSTGAELRSTELARRVGLAPGRASSHLGQLATLGLVQRRRSGAAVHYRLAPAEGPAQEFSPAALVRQALLRTQWAAAGRAEDRIQHLSARTVAKVPGDVAQALDRVYDAATAFTNVRRLQILDFLKRTGDRPAGSLVSELSMSPTACERHLDKLQRRGYVRERSPGVWSLSERQRTWFHRELLAAVVAATGA